MNDFDFFKKEHQELNDKLLFQNKKKSDYDDDIKSILNGTYITPLSTGIPELDPMFKMFLGMLLIITGYPQSGKSELANFLACYHVTQNRGKSCIFSPESDTAIMVVDIINTVKHLLKSDWSTAESLVEDNFIFKEIKDELGLPDIKHLIDDQKMLNKEGYNFFVIDPMNWVTSSLYTNSGMFESLRLTLTYLKQTAKITNSIVCYVEHPKTPQPQRDGTIPLCSIFSANGGVMHNNKTDGALILHRKRQLDEYGKPKSSKNDPVLLEVAKLKFQKYLGTPDNILLHFDQSNNTYQSWDKYMSSNNRSDINYEKNEVFKKESDYPF